MLESADGFSVSLTRQWSGSICGGGAGGGGGAFGGGGGVGGGVKIPAGTSSDDTTTTCAVDNVFRLSHGAEAATVSTSPMASMSLLSASHEMRNALFVFETDVVEEFRI